MNAKRPYLLEKAISEIDFLINSGQFVPGSLMMSERELASRLNVSRATIQRAFSVLEAEGKFRKLSRRGTIVAPPKESPVQPGRAKWAVLVPTMEYYYPPIIHEIEKEARRLNIRIQLNCIGDDIDIERDLIDQSIVEGVRGIILAPGTPKIHVEGRQHESGTLLRNPESLDYLAGLPVPVVVIDHFGTDIPSTGIDCIIKDDFAGTYQSTVHMIQHGHKKIGCFIGLAPGQTTQGYEFIQRRKGFEAAMADYGLSGSELPHLRAWDVHNNHRALKKYIDAGYDSFVFTDDGTAALFMRILADWNIKVPDDIAVIGYDDDHICQMTNPTLSSVSVPKNLMARKAVEILQQRIESGSRGNYRSIILKPSIVTRASCGCKPMRENKSHKTAIPELMDIPGETVQMV